MIILPPLRFYVKSNFGEFKRSKIVIFAVLEVLKFNFSSPKFTKILGSLRVSKNVKKAIFEIQILANAKLSAR